MLESCDYYTVTVSMSILYINAYTILCSVPMIVLQLLEKALTTYPATMPAKERWIAIANDVPSETPKECLARFGNKKCLMQKSEYLMFRCKAFY